MARMQDVCVTRDEVKNTGTSITITAKVKLDWRIRVGLWLMRVGAWVAGIGYNEEEESDDLV